MQGSWTSRNPADEADVLGHFEAATADDVAAAVGRARRAAPAWRELGVEGRATLLRRYAELANEKKEEGARLIARETGKALWDARGEAGLLGPKVDVTLAEGMRFVAPIDVSPGIRSTMHPRGVLAVLGPFNFPAHLPNGHIVPALATGNTVVFKPSDLTPAVGAWMVELFREAGIPEGILEIVQGGAETGRALAVEGDVDGVLFTGSWAVGRALSEATLDQPGKILALEMGGKNAMVVCDDAKLDLAVAEAALSIAATTGQRCSCLSRIFVARGVEAEFSERLARVLAGLRVGPPLEDGVFMGPLVSLAAHEKVTGFRAMRAEAGAEVLLDGATELPPPFVGAGLVRFASAAQPHPYQRQEIFGPEAAIYPVDDLDEAIAAVNDSEYGLAASLISRDRAHFERCVGRVRTGILNWNKGTIGASGKLPFGGEGRSGNDRPAGVLATVYCTMPQAHLESLGDFNPKLLPPGIPEP